MLHVLKIAVILQKRKLSTENRILTIVVVELRGNISNREICHLMCPMALKTEVVAAIIYVAVLFGIEIKIYVFTF